MASTSTEMRIQADLMRLIESGVLESDKTLMRLYFGWGRLEFAVFAGLSERTFLYYSNDELAHPNRIVPRRCDVDAIKGFEIINLRKLVGMLNEQTRATTKMKMAAREFLEVGEYMLS